MPLDRTGRLTDQNVAMERADDLGRVFDALAKIPERGFFTRERAENEIAEEIGYQLVVHPEWVAPYVDDLVRNGVTAAMTFDPTIALMRHASPELVAEVIARVERDPADANAVWLLLAAGTDESLAAIGRLAAVRADLERDARTLGYDVRPGSLAVPRFGTQPVALRLREDLDPIGAAHAAGLPLDHVVAPGDDTIRFHYASLTPSAIAGSPDWRGQAHLVAPRAFTGWTLFTEADGDGRVRTVAFERDEDDTLDHLLDEAIDRRRGAIESLPFDDGLDYVNQHVLATPGVFGVAGGAPIGLTPAPACPRCERVMWHVGAIDPPAEYGDGFRSLFICEDDRISATLATLWN